MGGSPLRLNQKQSTGKQKDGEQTPHIAKFLQAGVVLPSEPLTAELMSISGGSYEPRDRHKQLLNIFMVILLDVGYFTNLTEFVNIKIIPPPRMP
jgi:hypothetical protein